MTVKRRPYNTYTKEFKLEALRLMEDSDRPASEMSTKPGIRRNQLYKWKEQISILESIVIWTSPVFTRIDMRMITLR